MKNTPKEREQSKSRKEKLDDWNYVSSHVAVCLATDFTPLISNWIQKKSDNHAHDHTWSHLGGEVAGDLAGLVATVVVQRIAPEVTAGIRTAIEPVARPLYEKSAEREANAWAESHQEIVGSEAYEAHKARTYEREMSKLPMGIIWTVTSLGFNTLFQKTLLGNDGGWGQVAASNAGGALATFALTNGMRVLLPRQMHHVDEAARKYIAEPVTSFISAVTGQGRVFENDMMISHGSV